MVGQVLAAVPATLSVILWIIVLLSACSIAYWTYLVAFVARGYEYPEPEYGPGDVQARFLTVDSEQIVQESVNALPAAITDRHVIAEQPMDIDGATVHVVPESFECAAIRKGRALEWARRHVACEKEYVLFLDEDSLVTGFDGVPDADVVQFRERPRRSGSWLTYLAEVFRLGFQVEQRAFPSLSVPLYAWGGGIAIRAELEGWIGWDRKTMIEDTTFVWSVAADEGVELDFALARATFDTQAPPTIRAMIGQRSRWIAGSQAERGLLSRLYRTLTTVRNLAWAFSPAVPLLTFVPLFVPGTIAFELAFQVLSVAVFAFVIVWSILGVRYYGESPSVGAALLVLTPIVSILHSLGAFAGLVVPPTDFAVTQKVEPELVETTDREVEGD
ncbi:glycosyltransferase family 2 protein [Halococcus agarilyticus]|uniref:glycosyltransferase family 2 protein n=1 Tax=Halococcus agarilyticus TaxID=1232219 RepID=UPI000677A225|nr:glycosyltransferase family 2 protein [Halococcus agarilyticus]